MKNKMKTNVGYKSLLMIFALVGLSLTSCDNKDDGTPVPVKTEDVNGIYSGKVTTTQGTAKNEATISFTANKNVITFDELPVKEIVQSVVKDAAKAEVALKTIGKVKYELNYTPALNKAKTAIELTFAPKTLEIKVPVDGATKNVVVTFSSPQKGVYKSKSLKFELSADKITSDGAAVTPYTAVKYSFPNFLKK